MTVSGDLRDMDLSSIISINCNEMNQARLVVRHRGREASLFFEGGNIVHMSLGSVEGEEVMHEIVCWKEGTFELEQGVPAPRRTVTTSWSELLLDGMQRLDEDTVLDSAGGRPRLVREMNREEEVSPMPKGKDVEKGAQETGVAADQEVAAEAGQEAAEVGEVTSDVAEVTEPGAGTVDLKSLATALFEMGLDRGLSPDEAALQVSKTRLPAFLRGSDRKEFKERLVEAYQESLIERVEKLRREMGFETDNTDRGK